MATMTKPTKRQAPAMSRAAEIGRERAELWDVAEPLLARRAAGDYLTSDEEAVFRALQLSTADVDIEALRAGQVANHLAKAGSRSAFAAAKTTAVETAEAATKGRAALEAKIAAMQEQLRDLNDAAATAARELDAMEQARRNLRDPRLLPRHRREEYEHASARHDRGVGHELVTARARSSALVRIISLDPMSRKSGEQIVLHASSLPVGHIAHPRAGREQPETVSVEAWRSYVANDLKPELQTLVETTIPELEAACRPDREAMEKLTTYFIDKL